MRNLYSLLFLIGLSLNLAAQKRPGSIKGNIVDEKTLETLPFVNVVIKTEKGAVIAGAATDFEGNYHINPVAAGTYSVEVSSIEYAKVKINEVLISPNIPTIQNFKLKMASCDMDVVTVCWITCCIAPTPRQPLLPIQFTDTLTTSEPALNTNELNLLEKGYSAFPNPTTGVINLEATNNIKSVLILDMDGKLLEKREEIQSQKQRFSLAKYPKGSYLMYVNINGMWQSEIIMLAD